MAASLSSLRQHGHPDLPLYISPTTTITSPNYFDSVKNFNKFCFSLFKRYLPVGQNPQEVKRSFDVYFNEVLKNSGNFSPKQQDLLTIINRIFVLILQDGRIVPDSFPRLEKKYDRPEPVECKRDFRSELPPEIPSNIWSLIFSYHSYDNWDQVRNVGLFLKDNNHAIFKPQYIKELLQSQPHLLGTLPNSSLVCQAATKPKKLHQPLHNLNDEQLKELAYKAEDLTSVTFYGGSFSLDTFAFFLKSCPHLKSIQFNNFTAKNTDQYFISLSFYCKNLASVKIIDCPLVTDESLLALSLIARRLNKFEFWNSHTQGAITDYGLLPLLQEARSLKTLRISGCQRVTQMPIIVYLQLKRTVPLENLAFSYCAHTDDQLLNKIPLFCPTLKSFEFGLSPTQNIHTQDNCLTLAGILLLPSLTSIKISDCCYLTENILTSVIAQKKDNLESLEIYRCLDIKIKQIKNFYKFKALHTFKYQPVTSNGPVNLEGLRNSTSKLKHLALHDCKITSGEIESLVAVKGSIQSLKLYGCGKIDRSLFKTIGIKLTDLQVLEIETDEIDVVDVDIERISLGCKQLTTLHLKSKKPSDSRLTSFSLFVIAHNIPQLIYLTLSNLSLRSMNSHANDLHHFLNRCLYLKHLGLPHSDMGIKVKLALLKRYRGQLLSIDFDQYNPVLIRTVLRKTKLGHQRYLAPELKRGEEKKDLPT